MDKHFGYLLKGAHNVQFQTYRYRSLHLLANLNFITIAGVLFFAIWLLVWLKEFCKRRIGPQLTKDRVYQSNYNPNMQNFVTRFIYECYFEMFLCTLISVAAERTVYTDDNFSSDQVKEAKKLGQSD